MILGTNTDIMVNLFLDGNKIKKSQEVALLGINIDDKVSLKRILKIFIEEQNTNYTRYKA